MCYFLFFWMYLLRQYLQLCVCMCLSPVDTTSWQRLQYIAIRLKHNCNRCYSVCVCLVYVLCVYICNYIFWYICIYTIKLFPSLIKYSISCTIERFKWIMVKNTTKFQVLRVSCKYFTIFSLITAFSIDVTKSLQCKGIFF